MKSFFGKEDELLAKPKAVPESASEALRGQNVAVTPRIVEKSLPAQQSAQPARLPFSPDELRAALQQPVSQKTTPAPAPIQQVEQHDLKYEIDQFEHALRTAHDDVTPTPTAIAPVRRQVQEPLADPFRGEPSFFDTVEHSALSGQPESSEILDRDVLHLMREFHRNQAQGKEYYVHVRDVRSAIERKVRDLKTLEKEWFDTRRNLDDFERGMIGIEREIELRTGELRELIQQSQHRSRLEEAVPAGKEFMLRDGRKLWSLLDLRIALRTMSDEVYHAHVVPGKNDFAAWVRNAVGEPALATEMERVIDRYQLEIVLSKLPTQ